MLNCIRGTTTRSGLRVQATLLEGNYEKGQKVSDAQMQQLNIEHYSICSQWNFTIRPRLPAPSPTCIPSEDGKVIF
jgi:hypothetical protein